MTGRRQLRGACSGRRGSRLQPVIARPLGRGNPVYARQQ